MDENENKELIQSESLENLEDVSLSEESDAESCFEPAENTAETEYVESECEQIDQDDVNHIDEDGHVNEQNSEGLDDEKSEEVFDAEEEFAVLKEDPQDFSAQKMHEQRLIEENNAKINSRKTSRSKWLNFAFFIISVIVLAGILYYQNKKYGIKEPGQLFSENIKPIWILYIFLCFLGIMACDTFKTWLLLYKATKISRPIISYKSTAICRYYDCITPFSFGGQPFQIYYMNARGVNGGISTSVPMAKYMFSQITFSLIAVIMIFVGSGMYGAQSSLVLSISIISLCINIFFLFLIIFATMSKKLAPSFLKWGIKVLVKIKLVKDFKKTYYKTVRVLLEYQRSIRFYLKSFWVSICAFATSAGMIVLKALIPYLIYVMFNGTGDVGFSVIFCKYIICELASMYIPLPGGAGMAELSFTAVFSALFDDGLLFWAMLIYRIASYYIYLLQGLLVQIYDLAIGNKRDKKYKDTKLVELRMKAMYKK